MEKKNYGRQTELLYQGHHITGKMDKPEADALHLTSAFNVQDLDEMDFVYAGGGFAYNRTNNPNRTALANAMTYLENGEDSIVCSCGMAAITNALMPLVKIGDHILSDMTLYGESIDFMTKVLGNFGVEVTYIDFTKTDEIAQYIRPNTKALYTETISNPMMSVVDIEAIARIAHEHNCKLVVDNTFTTTVMMRPLDLGADVVVNSLTKFVNGHSDCLAGSITGKKDYIKECYDLQVLLGSQADAFSCWLVLRSIRTLDMRVMKAMDNAAKLAAALEKDPHLAQVIHPSLESHPQHELAGRIFDNGYGAMLSFFVADEDREKMNKFMRKLEIVEYAMTLGGFRTTIAHPVTSSHSDLTEEERLKLGITFGLIRVSVGMEDPDDLIADFTQALRVYDE